jgi:hypothetical protein
VEIAYTPAPALVDQPVTLSAVVTDRNDDVIRYEWNLDGEPGYERVTTEPHVSTAYATPGTHPAAVRVTDSVGYSLEGTGEISVVPRGDAPLLELRVEPNPAEMGDLVTFYVVRTGGGEPRGTASYVWDVDGDGNADPGKDGPVERHRYRAPGDYNATVVVAYSEGGEPWFKQALGQAVRVDPDLPNGEGPTARLDIDPNPAGTGETVTFDASGSTDPTGDIVSYEWDLDGFPGYEIEPDGASSQRRSYDVPDTFTVSVRVTDAAGHSDVDSQALQVDESTGRVLAAGGRSTQVRPFSATLSGVRDSRGAGLEFDGRGRLRARLSTAPKLTRAERTFKRFLNARWQSRSRITFSRRDRRARLQGLALARRGRDRACLRVNVDLRAGELPRGTFTVLGGTRTGAKLRGTGSFRFQVVRGKPAMILGHLRATRGRARGLPAGCRRLAR